MTDLLIVAVEAMWPPRQGGHVRMAGLVEALSQELDVVLAVPGGAGQPPEGIVVRPLASRTASRRTLRGFARRGPRLGHSVLGKSASAQLQVLVAEIRPRAVLFTHNYLAAVAPDFCGVPVAVDFPNLETRRLATFARRGRLVNRASAFLEWCKALRWEPRLALAASLCLALDPVDANQLERWGGRVRLVTNAVGSPAPRRRSPDTGPAVYLASGDYAPNVDGGRWLVEEVWPLVRSEVPDADLVLAGRGTETAYRDFASVPGIRLLGEVDDATEVLDGAAVVSAPVTSGGGQQLKVLEALSRRRLIVATTFSARSVPAELMELCIVADDPRAFADALTNALVDSAGREKRENAAASAVAELPTWERSVAPLVSWVRTLP